MQMLSLVKTLIIHLGEYFKRRELWEILAKIKNNWM